MNRRIMATAIAALVMLGATSCFAWNSLPGSDERTAASFERRHAHLEDVRRAVLASDPRVVSAGPVSRYLSGFSVNYVVRIELQGNEDMTPRQLRRIIQAVWDTAKIKPVAIDFFVTDSETGEPISLANAARTITGYDGDPEHIGARWNSLGGRESVWSLGSLMEVDE